MDMGSIAATISGLKNIGEIVNSILDAKASNAINAAVSEVQSHLMSVQREALTANSEQFAMIEEIRNLKEKIAEMEAWGTEKQRYYLKSPWPGTVVYALRESLSNGEPPHWICTNCYNDGMKSILTQQQDGNAVVSFLCPKCKTSFRAIGRHSKGFNLTY
jgi:Zn finger protein HypA/HybF involved in hydrogenase expression